MISRLVGMQTGIATVEKSVQIPEKTGNGIAIGPTAGHTPQGNQI